jgi:hypothetical protein
MKRHLLASLSLISRDSSIHAKPQLCCKYIRRHCSASPARVRYAPCGSENLTLRARAPIDADQCSNVRRTLPEKELGPSCSKTRKTQVTYEGYFKKWILPRWRSYRVTEVKAVAVEQWLRSLNCEWEQSQGSKHHEHGFQSRCQVGMAWCESHTHGASKR